MICFPYFDLYARDRQHHISIIKTFVFFFSVFLFFVFVVSFSTSTRDFFLVFWFCVLETHPKSVIVWCCRYHFQRRGDVYVSRWVFRDWGMLYPFRHRRPSFGCQNAFNSPWITCVKILLFAFLLFAFFSCLFYYYFWPLEWLSFPISRNFFF